MAKTPKTVATAWTEYEWSGWDARLRDDDSLIVDTWSRISGTMTNVKTRHTSTGLIAKIDVDPERDPSVIIGEFFADTDPDAGQTLRRGHKVF